MKRRLGVDPKGLAGAGFLRVPRTSEQQGLQQSQGPEGAEGQARGRGGQAERLAVGRVGWQAEAPSRGTPSSGEAVGAQAPLASGEAPLPRCSPLLRPPARAAWSRACKDRAAAHARSLRSRRLRGGNARRPLQAWCRWSALGSPRAAPARGALVRPACPRARPPPRRCARRVTRAASRRAGGGGAAPPCVPAGGAWRADLAGIRHRGQELEASSLV